MRKKRISKAGVWEKCWLTRNIQDELAQRDRKHRDKYTGENKHHLEGVETITRTGETDQGVTQIAYFSQVLSLNVFYIPVSEHFSFAKIIHLFYRCGIPRS